jgi:hypothetical protein
VLDSTRERRIGARQNDGRFLPLFIGD